MRQKLARMNGKTPTNQRAWWVGESTGELKILQHSGNSNKGYSHDDGLLSQKNQKQKTLLIFQTNSR